MEYFCKYCGKKINNKGCLVLHEKRCKNNQDRIISKTQAYKEDKDSRRGLDGKIIIKKPWHHTEETKNKLSASRKRWLSENPDKHVWKSNKKFLSVPCENLKEFLRNKGICFVEEYEPFDDHHYSVDIAWPDEKIGIEVNGNQHYLGNGKLKPYYQKRHNLFTSRGWKLFEIHYSKCFNIDINSFTDILKLPIYDKNYTEKYLSNKIKKEAEKNEKIRLKETNYLHKKNILQNLVNYSGIDFSKPHWSNKAVNYLILRNELFDRMILRSFKRYFPEFLKTGKIWLRKGTKL